jgi:hypothetical protein
VLEWWGWLAGVVIWLVWVAWAIGLCRMRQRDEYERRVMEDGDGDGGSDEGVRVV